ncbi:ROK family protein [Steroidobacter sp.]|uniref:ROK family protein n=1 Tax=Steroidobacter sp. TaxID=1978227 RepID=UPI001A493E45|nr:ROK family protein [Steroidobacter sp.]MBL8268452.1 ROK family protein [Steroidobacter sp.]
MLYGAIEGGGTKFVCSLGHSAHQVLASTVLPTTSATATLAACVEFFAQAEQQFGRIDAFGFGCFGPIDLRSQLPGFGQMLATPKPGWSRVDLLSPLRSRFAVPIALDTDVGAASLAEWHLGAGRGLGSLAYVTVGTGIGGGVAPADPTTRRLMHAEMGHIIVRRDARDEGFAGVCPFHGDCLEGLASGPAIQARWHCPLEALPADHEAWSIVGGYLGQLAAAIALMISVERVLFGGGVMANGRLLPHIRAAAADSLKGYLEPLSHPGALDDYIRAPELGTGAGIAGAFLLAEQALHG